MFPSFFQIRDTNHSQGDSSLFFLFHFCLKILRKEQNPSCGGSGSFGLVSISSLKDSNFSWGDSNHFLELTLYVRFELRDSNLIPHGFVSFLLDLNLFENPSWRFESFLEGVKSFSLVSVLCGICSYKFGSFSSRIRILKQEIKF